MFADEFKKAFRELPPRPTVLLVPGYDIAKLDVSCESLRGMSCDEVAKLDINCRSLRGMSCEVCDQFKETKWFRHLICQVHMAEHCRTFPGGPYGREVHVPYSDMSTMQNIRDLMKVLDVPMDDMKWMWTSSSREDTHTHTGHGFFRF